MCASGGRNPKLRCSALACARAPPHRAPPRRAQCGCSADDCQRRMAPGWLATRPSERRCAPPSLRARRAGRRRRSRPPSLGWRGSPRRAAGASAAASEQASPPPPPPPCRRSRRLPAGDGTRDAKHRAFPGTWLRLRRRGAPRAVGVKPQPRGQFWRPSPRAAVAASGRSRGWGLSRQRASTGCQLPERQSGGAQYRGRFVATLSAAAVGAWGREVRAATCVAEVRMRKTTQRMICVALPAPRRIMGLAAPPSALQCDACGRA